MPFHVERSGLNNNVLIHLRDKNHSTTVTVIPATGAMLHEFIIHTPAGEWNIIENYNLEKPLHQQVTNYFRSVKLSPWVCRLDNGSYQFENTNYQVERMFADGTALHGLLFDQPFTITSEYADEHEAGIEMIHHYEGYDPGYPFHFSCAVTYALRPANELEVTTRITNNSDANIPVSDGWHPYFRLGGKVNDWSMKLNADMMLEFNDRLIPTGKAIPFSDFENPAPIRDRKLDNCFVLRSQNNVAACTIYNPTNRIWVALQPLEGYPYLQVYIPDDRESIAVENISGAPDSFNNKIGLTVLKPRETKTFRVIYRTGVRENV